MQNLQRILGAPLTLFLSVAAFGLILGGMATMVENEMHLLLVVAATSLVAAFVSRFYAISVFVIAVPLITLSKTYGPVPIDAVTLTTLLLVTVFLIHKISFSAISKKNDDDPTVRDSTIKEVEPLIQLEPSASKQDPFNIPFLMFILAGLVSMFVAVDIVGGIAVLVRYVGYFLLVIAVGYLIKDKDQLSSIFILMVITGALSTIAGLFDYAYRPDQSIGLQGLSDQISGRLAGTYENPNFFGEYLILIIPLGIGVIMSCKSIVRQFALGFLVLVLMIALGLTYTRGSWLGLGLGLVVFALLTKRQLIWLFIAGSSSLLFFVPGFLERLLSSFNLSEGTASFRLKLWQVPLQMISDHPITGVGIGNYLNTFSDYVFKFPELSVGWVIYGAHNTYLAIAAEMGLFGLLSFILIILVMFRIAIYIYNMSEGDSTLRYLNAAVAASMIGYLFNNLTSNSLLHPRSAVIFWFLLGVQLVLLRSVGLPRSLGSTRSIYDSSSLVQGSRAIQSRLTNIFSPLSNGSALLGILTLSIRESVISGLIGSKPNTVDVVGGSMIARPALAAGSALQKIAVKLNFRDQITKHETYLGYFVILTIALSLYIGQLVR